MASHLEIGKAGEKLAEEYLIQHGYTILPRNWRHGHDELDLIATKNDLLRFVEVKYRSSNHHGHPEDAVAQILGAARATAADNARDRGGRTRATFVAAGSQLRGSANPVQLPVGAC